MADFSINRRHLLAGAMAATAMPARAAAAAADDANGLAARIRSGDASARETVLAALERAEAAQA